MYNGRSFDLYNSPLPDGGYVVSAVETTALIGARADAEQALAQTTTAVATLRIGVGGVRFGRHLAVRQSPVRGVAGPAAGTGDGRRELRSLLDLMATRDEFGGADGALFVAAQRAVNRTLPSCGAPPARQTGRLISVESAPLPDGGWTITLTDISPLAQAEDEAQRRARLLDSILAAVPHGICVYSADHRVTLFNRAYTQVMAGAPLPSATTSPT